jgi:hypothetical protein
MQRNFPDIMVPQNSLVMYTEGWQEESLSGREVYFNLPKKYFEGIIQFDRSHFKSFSFIDLKILIGI